MIGKLLVREVPKVKVTVGRSSGPCTDLEAASDFPEDELETVKAVVAMVNTATGDKEGWYIRVETITGQVTTIPVARSVEEV